MDGPGRHRAASPERAAPRHDAGVSAAGRFRAESGAESSETSPPLTLSRNPCRKERTEGGRSGGSYKTRTCDLCHVKATL